MDTLNYLNAFFERFDTNFSHVKSVKLAAYTSLEQLVHTYLHNISHTAEAGLNRHRNDLLDHMHQTRDTNLQDASTLRANFAQSHAKPSESLFTERLSYQHDFSMIYKLKYLHVLVSQPISHFDLFDFKHVKNKIRYSAIISPNTILTLISVNENEYVIRTHKFTQSSFKTARETLKKAIVYWEFQAVSQSIYMLYRRTSGETRLEQFDFNLNMLASVLIELEHVDRLKLLTNTRELIVDCGTFHVVFDLSLRQLECLSSHGDKLVNISKDYVIYTKTASYLDVISRHTGILHVKLGLDQILSANEWSVFYLIDYESRMLIKAFNSSEVYFVDFNSPECQLSLLQNKFDLYEHGVSGVYGNGLVSSKAPNRLVLYKNERYTQRYKHAFII